MSRGIPWCQDGVRGVSRDQGGHFRGTRGPKAAAYMGGNLLTVQSLTLMSYLCYIWDPSWVTKICVMACCVMGDAKTCWDGPDKMPTKKLIRTKCQPQKKSHGQNANLGWHFVRLAFCPVGILSYHHQGAAPARPPHGEPTSTRGHRHHRLPRRLHHSRHRRQGSQHLWGGYLCPFQEHSLID